MWRAAACAIGAALVGCGGSADKTAVDTAAKTASTPKAAAGGNKIVIAMIAKSSTNAVFLAARTGAEAAAKDLSAKNNMPVEVMWSLQPYQESRA